MSGDRGSGSKKRWMAAGLLAATTLLVCLPAIAGEPAVAQAAVNTVIASPKASESGDTAWVLISSALVMLMTPGLAFFYGGLVSKKNVLSILMQCFAALCIVSLQWVLIGYSLAFGPDVKGVIGDLSWAGLKTVEGAPNTTYAATVPHLAFMCFQMMFAVITPALVIGAFAERIKFSAFVAFTLIWTTIVYDPVAHWVWGDGGFLRQMGALDFAGGTVVHVNAGIAALVAALMLGRRSRYPEGVSPPHSLPLATLGAGLLWFGWFGFNAGSALGAGATASYAFVSTHIATASAGLAWAVLDWILNKKPTTLGVITGAVAGLVSVTPACGFIHPIDAIWIGFGASGLCYVFVSVIKPKLGYDDALDAFGVHGVGGIWGSLATGIWASKAVNESGADGLAYGNPALFWVQLKTVLITIAYSLVMTYAIFKVVDLVVGLRVGDNEERIGLDLTQHREAGYTMLE